MQQPFAIMPDRLLAILCVTLLTSSATSVLGSSWHAIPLMRHIPFRMDEAGQGSSILHPSPRLNLERVRVRVPDKGSNDQNPSTSSEGLSNGTQTELSDFRPEQNATAINGTEFNSNDSQVTSRSSLDDGKKVTTVRWINDSVTIGPQTYRKEMVTPVGDIDGNGHVDLVVAAPHSAKNTGSIRLYIMGAENTFLFSRELVPGHWGFAEKTLKPGDLFGSAVHKLPVSDFNSPCVLAIGAPGDGSNGKKRGAVYIIQVSERGNVSKSVKISPETDRSLARQLEDNEGFGTEISSVGDINGDGDFELSVKSSVGSTTILFLSRGHEMKTGIKFHGKEHGLMSLVNSQSQNKSLQTEGLKNLSVRPASSGVCFFNETNCACGMKTAEQGSASCYDIAGTDIGTGKTTCQARDCMASYVCSCDGTEFCSRTEETRQVLVPDGSAGGDNVFCHSASMTSTTNTLLVGIPLPSVQVAEDLSYFNATHCRCASKAEVTAPYQCLDVLQTNSPVAVICTSRVCNVNENELTCDAFGSSYCKREVVSNNHYVNDGSVAGEAGSFYCHLVASTKDILTKLFDVAATP